MSKPSGYVLELLTGSKGIPGESLIWQRFKGLSKKSHEEGISTTYQACVDQEPNQATLLSWMQRGEIRGFLCYDSVGQLLWGYPGALGDLGGYPISSDTTPSHATEKPVHRLVASEKSGYYAFDVPEGRALAFGDHISIEVATDMWIDGIVDHSIQLGEAGCYNSKSLEEEECGHYFISSNGSQVLGLCTGMCVKLLEEDEVYWQEKRS